MTASLIGQKVGRYKVVAELGRGQHSVVYKAWQSSLERHVALKVLRRHDQETLQKFQSEARLTAYLIQQGVANIRQVYEVGQTEADASGASHIFVALEYVEESLQNFLRRARERGQRMNPMAAAKLLMPVAEALDSIHSLGWVHLDIKPQNILISRDGRTMLADFGIAQRRGTQTHACTPTYASPEQAAGNRPVGPWSDVYSLGAVLYEMVAGHPPVRGDHDIVLLNQHLEATPPSPRRVNLQLSANQERAIYKSLAKSHKDRYATASDLIRAMLSPDTLLSSVIQSPGVVVGRASGWLRQVPRLALVGGLLVLLLTFLVLVSWILWPLLSTSTPTATVTTPLETVPPTAIATALPTATDTRQPTATIPATSTEAPTVTLMPTP